MMPSRSEFAASVRKVLLTPLGGRAVHFPVAFFELLLCFFRLFSHVLGMYSFVGQTMVYLLLLGPACEAYYGSEDIAAMLLVQAGVEALYNMCTHRDRALTRGASGAVHVLILLTGLMNGQHNKVSLIFLLVVGNTVWQQGNSRTSSNMQAFASAAVATVYGVMTERLENPQLILAPTSLGSLLGAIQWFHCPVILFMVLGSTAVHLTKPTWERIDRHMFTAPSRAEILPLPGIIGLPYLAFKCVSSCIGHADAQHLSNNLTWLLLVGPGCENAFGSDDLAKMILVECVVGTAANHVAAAASNRHSAGTGASGVVFMLTLLTGLVNRAPGKVPLVFLLLAAQHIPRELNAFCSTNNPSSQASPGVHKMSHLAHLVGGVVGAWFGFQDDRVERLSARQSGSRPTSGRGSHETVNSAGVGEWTFTLPVGFHAGTITVTARLLLAVLCVCALVAMLRPALYSVRHIQRRARRNRGGW